MLAELLHKIAAMEAAEREVAYRPRPSSAGPEDCLRKLVYFARGTPREPLLDRLAMVLDDSSVHEELTAKWIEQSGFTLHDRQMRVEIATVTHQGRPFTLAGSIDGLVTDFGGHTWLWEHKALATYSWERYWEGAWPLNYFTQCALYLTGLQRAGWTAVTEALLLMKNKNTADYLEFRLAYDPDGDELRVLERIKGSTGERVDLTGRPDAVFRQVRAQAIARCDAVEAHWAAGTLPERPYVEPQSFPCGYCPYRQRCWQNWTPQALDQRITLSPEDAVLVAEYQALSEELRPKYRRKEELADQLKLLLKANGAREAVTDTVLLRLEQRTQRRLEPDLIPAEIREAATRPIEQEYLKVLPLRPR
ncbi:PD-(D/E)XK nuclease family protein [Nitrospira sp. Kam-Ns4a]